MTKRLHPLLFVLVFGAMLIAVPTGLGTPPEQEDTIPGPNVVPAGVGCSFAVRRVPANAQVSTTTFSNGTVQQIARATVTLTNLASGRSTVWQTANKNTRIPGVGGQETTVSVDGSFTFVIRPGELSPLASVAGPALLGLSGHLFIAQDPTTAARTSIAFDGQAVDLCALLS